MFPTQLFLIMIWRTSRRRPCPVPFRDWLKNLKKQFVVILLDETWVKKTQRFTDFKAFALMMDEYVRFPKSLFQEFIVLWGQVESISPTFSNDAQKLIGKVKNTIGKIKSQVRSSECENPGTFK